MTIELGFCETGRSPAGYWAVRVDGDRVSLDYIASPELARPEPDEHWTTTVRALLEEPPPRLARDIEVSAALHRALVSQAGTTAHSFRSTASRAGARSELRAHVEGGQVNWVETREGGAQTSGSVPITALRSLRDLPSFHFDLWRRLSRLADVLALAPADVAPADPVAIRRSPVFAARYERDGYGYRTELFATPARAFFEMGPDEGTARSHEGGGFDVPLDEVLGRHGLRELRGESPVVVESLVTQLRAWIDERVDPRWSQYARPRARR